MSESAGWSRPSLALLMLASLASILLLPASPALAQVSVDIGVNVPVYPQLVQVPGYPVYYNPRASSNYFFYDGLYWVYQGDRWYRSGWYNGPWRYVGPEEVPLYVLRVPVRYYHRPPSYFHGWRADAPPRWGEHWGPDWERRRGGWDRWDRHSVPPPAPLPLYQRQYSGGRYPHAEQQQHSIRSEQYRYQPHDAVSQQHFAGPHDGGRDGRGPTPDRGRDNRAAPAPDLSLIHI